MTVLVEIPTKEKLAKLRREYKVLGIVTPDMPSEEAAEMDAASDVALTSPVSDDPRTWVGIITPARSAQWGAAMADIRNEWERTF